MSQQRLTEFMRQVNVANKDFTKKRSCLENLIDLMEAQVRNTAYSLPALAAAIASARRDKRGAKYEAALKYVEATWGQPDLQYKGPNQAGFSGLTGRLYVVKGSSITIQQTGTANQQVVSFPTTSASNDAAGEKTVTARFGNTDFTVKAIVFELKAKLTFKDNFAGRSVDDVGLDERLTLGFETVPAGITAASIGGLRWSVKDATGAGLERRKYYGMLQTSELNAADPADDGTAYYIAPFVTDPQFPKNPLPSKLSRPVELVLTIRGGPMEGATVRKVLTLHTPQARMVSTGVEKHVLNKPSAGFVGNIFFDPKTVSFKTMKFMEGRGTLVARQTAHPPLGRGMDMRSAPVQGALPPHPSGYFAFDADRVHAHTGGGGVTIKGGNSATGCQINGSDTVYSGYNSRYPNPYDGVTYPSVARGLLTNVPSSQKWPIYWKVYPVDLNQSEGILIQQVTHESAMDANGRVTISKAGTTVSKNLADPTENP